MLHRSGICGLARKALSVSVNPTEGFFAVDRCVVRCYKPQKDKPFGGESPNELPRAVRE